MQANLFKAIVKTTTFITPKVKQFILEVQGEQPFYYLPGQFITVFFENDGKMLKRSYSIANAPTGLNQIEFAASFVEGGPGSQFLFHLNPGDEIKFSGPFGRLIIKEPLPKRYIFVATSTGITPFRAMLTELSHLISAHPSLKIVLLQGIQKREDILYKEEWQAWAEKHPQVSYQFCLSRAEHETLLPNERRGYVQEALNDLALNPVEDRVYLCGNPMMIDAAFKQLQALGFGPKEVIREKYISN